MFVLTPLGARMKYITHLTRKLICNKRLFRRFLLEINRPTVQETEHYFEEAKKLGATHLQLFNLAGACYAQQKEGHMRSIDMKNFDYIKSICQSNYYLPKNHNVKVFRGLPISSYDKNQHSDRYIKKIINNERKGWESWTLRKDIARKFTRGEGFILEATINTSCPDILGAYVYCMKLEDELIIERNSQSYNLEYVSENNM
jgi:hypothetical protein